MSRSDSELWLAVLSDDQSAWSELVDRYKSVVYATCTVIGLSQSDAKDVFQQTWLQLFRHRKRIQDSSRICSWLITTAKREAILIRKRSTSRYAPTPVPDQADPADNPEDQLLALECQAQLEIALSQLDTPCRDLLKAFFFAPDDQGYENIAATLGYSANTLGAKRRRCLDRLKKILIDMGYLSERKGM